MNRTIVVGWHDSELFAPYPVKSHKKRISRIRERAERLGAERYRDAESVELKRARTPEDEIEVFGMWEDMCVAALVAEALEKGYKVRVPRNHTIRNPHLHIAGNTLEQDVEIYLGAKETNKKTRYDFFQDRDFSYFRPNIES